MKLEMIYEAVLYGDALTAGAETKAALAANISAQDILQKACIPAMGEVGELFECGEKFVPEMLVSARAMQAVVGVLEPLLVETAVEPLGKIVLGTVAHDLHDIGKNLVSMMLAGAGFEIIDLGVAVAPEEFVAAVQEYKPDLVGLSALLTTTMGSIPETLQALQAADLRDGVKVIVGGAPLTPDFAEQAGADGFAPDAGAAVRLAKSLVQQEA